MELNSSCKQRIVAFFRIKILSLERLNRLPLNTVKPNFVAIFVFFGTATSFIDKICSSFTEAQQEAILFFSVSSEVNSTSLAIQTLFLKRV